MTDDTETRRGGPVAREDRSRPTDRAEEVASERRKRPVDTSTDPTLRRFGLTEEDIDRAKYDYRAVVDDKTRLLELTKHDDYDFITDKGGKSADKDADGVLRYQSGNNLDGSPQYTYLLRKPKKFADEDRARRIAKIDAEEKARLTKAPEDAPDKSYTPGKPRN